MRDFCTKSLEHEKSYLNLLVSILLVGFRGFCYLGCHMGDLSTNSLEYEESDLSLLEVLPLWGFIIQGAMWEIFAQIHWSVRDLTLAFFGYISLCVY